MTDAEKLVVLKADLQTLTNANDPYLTQLLSYADDDIKREGVSDDGSAEYASVQIMYAAYLFRKRAATTAGGKTSNTAMPRFLRWALNNLLFSQKAGDGS